MGMSTTYTVGSLDDLAKFIEERANEIEAMATGARTQKESRRFQAQAGGLRMAARIVKNTTIEGSNDG